MKDAFGNTIKLQSIILYSTASGAGTEYHYGEIVKLYPYKKTNKSYSPPDRVEIQVNKSNKGMKFRKNPVVYASNVVLQSIKG